MSVKEVSLALPKVPFSLDWLPKSACLVGGAVRDALLKREKSYFDLDFVVPENAIEIAKQIANYYHVGFVILDETRQIARVVFPEGTLDFAQQEGQNLVKDLNRRDFTINAIAYNFHEQKLIDPLHGFEDLKQSTIRMVSYHNLVDDPLRLLRAYRQAAQLNFTIEPTTRKTIKQLANLLTKVAAERVQSELNYLLAIPESNQWLIAAWEDGLLDFWLPQISREQLEKLSIINAVIDEFNQTWQAWKSNYINWLSLAKLALLVTQEPQQAEAELINLKYSRQQIKVIITILRQLPKLQQNSSVMSLKEQYFFFLEVKDIFPILVVVAIAQGVSRTRLNPLIARYLNPQDSIAHPQPLVNGNDLIKNLSLQPSPLIGKLLTEIQVAYIEGNIANKAEALEFAQSFIEKFEVDKN
ncbi:Polynucleotide adenylyltransferase region [Stanieria cyanosphaera PCC 7437]|uniref:Polynucleotide adenylyltransferase region n=1 Tax=Stanieria cyanosphaera (strain ATCC 29371 / PCC 7437) TaxID=111780 RepID=K9XW18_STAC7|nr:CCA tRNA nucleotidyltransferase [Stanieria cyanosphaera]AFZ35862.1 Polynucleotide adenylyltransferase region [Stanieria cyanosphaera PCC 7437]